MVVPTKTDMYNCNKILNQFSMFVSIQAENNLVIKVIIPLKGLSEFPSLHSNLSQTSNPCDILSCFHLANHLNNNNEAAQKYFDGARK